MIQRQSLRWIALCLSLSMLAGCSPPLMETTQGDIIKTKNKIDQAEAVEYPPPAPVVTQSGAYVDTTRVSLIKPPRWLDQQVTLRGNNLPFSFYVTEILGDTNARVHFDKTVDKKKTLSFDYTGDIQGALEELATKTDYYYDVDKKNNAITWSAFMTKTFDISFMPGTAAYQVGKSSGGSDSNSGSDADFGYDTSSDDQYSQFVGDISLWNDLETAIKSLLSEEGKAHVSQSTTTVTIHDHPENVNAIRKYLAKMNRELSRQVRLQVQILEVRLNDNFSQGINWDLVRNVGNQTISLVSNNFSNVGISDLNAAAFTFAGQGANSIWQDSNTIVQMLEQQGKVSIVTQPSLTTLNNQVAQIAVQELQNYVSEVTNTLNDSFSQASVDTGTITTGLMLYLLPKIQGENVFLQVSSNISVLLELLNYNTASGGPTIITDEETTSPNNSFVQLPQVASRLINQRAVIPSGYALVLAGFKEFSNTNNQSQLFGSDALGARAAQASNTEIVLLITPSILSTEDTLEEDIG